MRRRERQSNKAGQPRMFNQREGLLASRLSSLVCMLLISLATSAAQAQPEADADGFAGLDMDLIQTVSDQFEASFIDGVPDAAKLEQLATRCALLANSVSDDEERFELLSYRARSLSLLIRLDSELSVAPAEEKATVKRDWLAQLRGVAEQIKQLADIRSYYAGDYWRLLANLAAARRDAIGAPDQQADPQKLLAQSHARAERFLQTYLSRYADVLEAAEYITDARLALAKLYDDRGDQAAAARQLGMIGQLPETSPRYAQTQRLRERIARIGQPVAIDAITTDLINWRSQDHAGRPVLIHIYADSLDPPATLTQALQDRIASRSLGGFSIVSLRVGEALADTPAPPWPVVPVSLETDGLLDQLGIDALPTLLWLNPQGQLASIGHTLAVLDQMPADQPAAPSDTPAQGDTDADPQGDTDAASDTADAPGD